MKRTVFAYPYIVWMLIFILAPMLLIIWYAFSKDGSFTLANLTTALKDPIYMQVLLRSVWIAFKATVICLLLGYPIAWFLSTMRKSTAAILDSAGILNVILEFFGLPPQHLLYTEGAIMLGTVYNFLPFMILPIYSVLVKLDKSLVEAAYDLGANGVTTFFKVILPQSVPGIISGITMVFIPAITAFAISRLLGGSKFMLYGDLIENQFITLGRDAWPVGSALSFILLVLVLISMAIMRRAEREAGEEGGMLW